jgi:hypothetical protein
VALKATINRNELKAQLGDISIFEHYFGPIEIGKNYVSFFRDEKRASTSFFISDHDTLVYRDFTTGDTYDCVQFVARLFGCSYYKAVNQIAIDFGLLPGKRSSEKPAVIKQISEKQVRERKQFVIELIPFAKHHLDFWAQYDITQAELVKYGIKAVGDLQIGDFKVPYDLRFFYPFKGEKDERYYKLYTPYSFDYKWLSSVPLNIPFGVADLPYESDTLIITKSVKDCLVLRKFFTDVIGLQNEGRGSLTPKLIAYLKTKYKHIYVWLDCDRTGIKAANYFRTTYGFKPVFVASQKLNIWQNIRRAKTKTLKDPSDFVKAHGLPTFAQYLKHIKLLP